MHRRDLAVLLALSFPLAFCSSPPEANAPAPGGRGGGSAPGSAVPVVTARVEQRSMPVTLPAVGIVEAITSVQVRAQVTGQLSAIHFAEGQDVQKGQPLFSLDARPFQVALQQAQAVLARDTATSKNAQSQQARSESLFQRGLIPRDQYESAAASVAALAGTIAADKAAVDGAQLNLQYTEIAAPISGRTGAQSVHTGDLIRANDTNAMVVINQLAPIYVTFSVPGRYLAEIRRYQSRRPLGVVAIAPVGGGRRAPRAAADGTGAHASAGAADGGDGPAGSAGDPVQGAVSFIDNAIDPATATIRLKGTFPNGGQQLWPGSYVPVTLDLTTESNALVVPATAVQASQEGQFVYVVKPDRTVEMRPVKVDRQHGDQVVVASGVSAGEVVVTDGQLRLTPGARVSERGEGGEGRSGTGPGGR